MATRRVLVVDDEDLIRWSLVERLRAEGYEVIEAAIGAGATTINIPDTVGYTLPHEFGALIEGIVRNVPGVENVVEVGQPSARSFLIQTKNGSNVMPDILRRATEGGWEVLEVGPERLSLEDAFFELTDRTGPVPDLLHAADEAGSGT